MKQDRPGGNLIPDPYFTWNVMRLRVTEPINLYEPDMIEANNFLYVVAGGGG